MKREQIAKCENSMGLYMGRYGACLDSEAILLSRAICGSPTRQQFFRVLPSRLLLTPKPISLDNLPAAYVRLRATQFSLFSCEFNFASQAMVAEVHSSLAQRCPQLEAVKEGKILFDCMVMKCYALYMLGSAKSHIQITKQSSGAIPLAICAGRPRPHGARWISPIHSRLNAISCQLCLRLHVVWHIFWVARLATLPSSLASHPKAIRDHEPPYESFYPAFPQRPKPALYQ